jgi:GTP cyclohydrolase I
MDQKRISKAVREILLAIGENPDRTGLSKTPDRVAKMYAEIFSGIGHDPIDGMTLFSETCDTMVIVQDIGFHSMCEHHLLPFFGSVHIAYIPQNNKILGLSKLARVVDTLSKRLQMQERFTQEIGSHIMQGANPLGVAVLIKAEHLCMTMRGVKKPESKTITTDFRGVFKTDPALRMEALTLFGKRE